MRVFLFVLLALVTVSVSVSVSAQGLTGPNFYITGNNGTLAYTFSINGAPVDNPSLTLTPGTTYKFILNATLTSHPFGFSTSSAIVTPVPIEDFTSPSLGGVSVSGNCTSTAAGTGTAWNTPTGETTNPCIVSITPPNNSSGLSIYYRCSRHSAMVGTLTAAGGSGSTTSTPTTSTSTPTTTSAPTTTPQPTGSSSTGKNGAAIVIPGAAVALLIAAINAFFSA